ncbi:23S rRNA (pseudouridine(1915)-N(3))-methyltransferase RlmH [Hyphomicrobium sp.]|uniref:23S rRNA (pseudouridine(1915)-N(3))-methyltransferase RlmH n=1 Tax=Hyphomicrobium sp. TaxID=82 RepID=UPI002BB52B64|nr:23S rRNA (pseudouridine(1915)-N(3))-methyltransferase RlmH [Hyphomicrobium sp.]HRN88231.1 23S rRNA (pseudouridine(1915)-N(3))-methyltransferase RlmH [Hyphomicrobium sp.]HRQ27408.1 23S rRNA (pseudouridine(1915)-N(3))-methyltransferase RlmH [Hyphomicrobium sp.]
MRLAIVAVGRLKDGPERALYLTYAKRVDEAGRALALGPLSLAELPEGRAAGTAQRRADEAGRILERAGDGSVLVALDGGGKALSSEAFAHWLAEKRDGGQRSVAFLIGGPDGHGDEVLKKASLKLSLGPMTLPHGLARIVLTEQLYRAQTILAGHPYHRA